MEKCRRAARLKYFITSQDVTDNDDNDQFCKKKKRNPLGISCHQLLKKYNCENFITINKCWRVCLSDGNAMIFCWMGSMYQLLSVWHVLFHSLPILTINPSMTPTERQKLVEVNLFPPPFFFTILPSDYRTADCLHSCFFSCCRHPFPSPPSFLLIPSQVVQWRPSSHYWGLIWLRADCARYLLPVQVVWHTATGWRGQPNVSADAARGWAVIGQRGWESPRDSVLSEGAHVKKLTLLVLSHLIEFDWKFDRTFDWKFEINISKNGLLYLAVGMSVSANGSVSLQYVALQ